MSRPLARLLAAIKQHHAEHGCGPSVDDLEKVLKMGKASIKRDIELLIDSSCVKRAADGRPVPIDDSSRPGNFVKRTLSPDELERLLRGEPSTGRLPSCGHLHPAVAYTPPAPPPTLVRVEGAPAQTDAPASPPARHPGGRPRTVSDEAILDAIKSTTTRAEAAALLGITGAGLSYRTKQLGLRARIGRPPGTRNRKIG